MHNHGNAGSRHARHPGLRARSWRKPSRNSPVPAAAPALRDGTADAFTLLWEPAPASGLQARFDALAARWREETEFHSAAGALFMHPAYQEIIGLGPAVLPLLLADLEKTRDHWFWALRAITGENPVPAEERGKVERMAEHWVDWGRARGLL